MRVGLVSPYSYTYPGGVLAHVEALADELRARGHEVRVLAPVDNDDRATRMLHRGAVPTVRDLPPADQFVDLGRTFGLGANGSVSNMAFSPTTAARLGHELRSGWYDVMHVHEPNAPRGVTKGQEILSQKARADGRAIWHGQLFREERGDPVAPE